MKLLMKLRMKRRSPTLLCPLTFVNESHLHHPVMNNRFIQVSIQSLRHRQKALPDKGLTLLELLVSVVIVGILSAIAVPSFLSFSTRARHAEAQVTVGSMLRAQQSYYTWKNEFAASLPDLELGISDSQHYRYRVHQFTGHRTLSGDQVDGTTAIAIPLTNLRGYMGKVWVDGSTGALEVKSVLCEGDIGATYFMDGRTYCQ